MIFMADGIQPPQAWPLSMLAGPPNCHGMLSDFINWGLPFINTMQTSALLGTYLFRQSMGPWWILALVLVICSHWAVVSNHKQIPGRQRRSSRWSIASSLLWAKGSQHELCGPLWLGGPQLWQPWYTRKDREDDRKEMAFHSLSTGPNGISLSLQPTAKNVLYCLLYSRNNPNEANRRQVRMLPFPVFKKPTFPWVVLVLVPWCRPWVSVVLIL